MDGEERGNVAAASKKVRGKKKGKKKTADRRKLEVKDANFELARAC